MNLTNKQFYRKTETGFENQSPGQICPPAQTRLRNALNVKRYHTGIEYDDFLNLVAEHGGDFVMMT